MVTRKPSPAFSKAILKTLVVLNLLCGVAIFALFVWSFVFETSLVEHFRSLPTGLDGAILVVGLRVLAAIGVLMTPLFHLVLTRLLAIVETVHIGDPFVPENAVRLTHIAWAMLGVQVLNLVFGVLSNLLSSKNAVIEWTFSLTGWIAVLLLFVLARVFEQGTRMRQDLEGTV